MMNQPNVGWRKKEKERCLIHEAPMPYTAAFLSGLQDKHLSSPACNKVPPHAIIIRIIIARSLHARVAPIRSEPVPTRVRWLFLLYFFPAFYFYRHEKEAGRKEVKA